MASERELDAMRLAIAVSARGLGTTSPNPPVGCVVLDRGGDIAGVGYHERKGEAHAEAIALGIAGERGRGGTAVVTLEPCNHAGLTPACRQALIDAGITRVVVALHDPTSRGEGGVAALKTAGVDVEIDVLADEARTVLGNWLTARELQRPIVNAAYQIAAHGDEPLDGHTLAAMRAGFDVVLDAAGHVEEAVPNSHGRGMLQLPGRPLTGTPVEILKELYTGGVRSVLLIGGRHIARRFGAAGCLDRLTVRLERAGEVPAEAVDLLAPGLSVVGVERTAEYVLVKAARTNPRPTATAT
jgi:diaminohydroxyphosphoribosylaminopyrimidine deaminase/5-amino-6-(5-phosphoribosylamino)uracil reductase